MMYYIIQIGKYKFRMGIVYLKCIDKPEMTSAMKENMLKYSKMSVHNMC